MINGDKPIRPKIQREYLESRVEFKRPRFMDKMNVRDKSIGRPAMITRTTGVVNKRGSDVREPLANGQVSRSTNLIGHA